MLRMLRRVNDEDRNLVRQRRSPELWHGGGAWRTTGACVTGAPFTRRFSAVPSVYRTTWHGALLYRHGRCVAWGEEKSSQGGSTPKFERCIYTVL